MMGWCVRACRRLFGRCTNLFVFPLGLLALYAANSPHDGKHTLARLRIDAAQLLEYRKLSGPAAQLHA
jgi:hypothetical protein